MSLSSLSAQQAEGLFKTSVEFVEQNQGITPALTVVIDTEEEFDWHSDHSRESTSVSSMANIGRVQDIFDDCGVRPCYVMDYPVATQKEGFLPLREICDSGRCTIGAHLHPWVSPPHDEPVTRRNTFPGNLPAALEAEKLSVLKKEIESNFQREVVIYKAGRYGFGVNTAKILESMGFQIDLSPSPGFNLSSEGGPNFLEFSNRAFWFGSKGDMLCLPCTGGFVGLAGKAMAPIYQVANQPVMKKLRTPGILSRLGVVDRIRLSPEGFSLKDLKKITLFLLRQNINILTLSFHSPSVVVGHTPYVKTESELKAFLELIKNYIHFFVHECGGVLMTPEEVKKRAEGLR